MTKEITETDFLNLAANRLEYGIVPTGRDNYNLALELTKQESILFANFIKDNSYTKDEQKGWYKWFTKREDFPEGFAMSTPVYEFLTIEDIYNLYLQQKTK